VEQADGTRSDGSTEARPRGTAALHVAPSGGAATNPRRYVVVLEVTPDVARADEITKALALAKRLLDEAFAGSSYAQLVTRDVWATDRAHRGQAAASALMAVEVELECLGWPGESTARLQTLLKQNGYRVIAEERRACAEEGCRSEAVLLPNRPNRRGRVDDGWYSETICGKHNYKTCPGCRSVFRLLSTNASGPAASVACTECGFVLVEWGSSKHWEIELVTASAVSS